MSKKPVKREAIYPGTFDPVTLGHVDVIERAAQVFDRLVVAVVAEPKKSTWFDLGQRIKMVRDAVKGVKGVEVAVFNGLLVDYARRQGVQVLVRGLRAFSDFEYEFQMALSNRKLAHDIETVFLMTSESFSYLSSSVVREVAELGGDTSEFVPPGVQKALDQRLKRVGK